MRGDFHDVVRESHVEHTVGLIEYEKAHLAQIDVAQTDVRDETSRRGDDHVDTRLHALQFLVVAVAVVAAVDCHAAHARRVVGKALHGLVDLLGELTCR